MKNQEYRKRVLNVIEGEKPLSVQARSTIESADQRIVIERKVEMKKLLTLFVILACTVLMAWAQDRQPEASKRITELDAYWTEVSRCVEEGDFEAYEATFHKDGILVSGVRNQAYPISQALKRWKPDFTQTKSGEITADVKFRFSQRLGDKTTAHETGMFLYSRVNVDGTKIAAYIHFEALLIKRGTWKAMMEYQKSEGTKEEWDKLN